MNKITLLSLSCALCLPSGAAVLWSIGLDDQAQDGEGDLANGLNDVASLNGTSFNVSGVQENGLTALPGNPANTGGTGGTRDTDDDYYFAGTYSSVVDGGTYTPAGNVPVSESFYDRAFTTGDPNNRWHFNVPNAVASTDILTFTIDMYSLDEADAADTSSFDLTFWVDGTQVGGMQSHSDADLGAAQSWDFGLADLGGAAQQGAGFDHYVEVRSTVTGSARWANIDYVQLETTGAVPEPTSSSLLLLSLAGLGFIRRRK